MPDVRKRDALLKSWDNYVEYVRSKIVSSNNPKPKANETWKFILNELKESNLDIPNVSSVGKINQIKSYLEDGTFDSDSVIAQKLHQFLEEKAIQDPQFSASLDAIKLPYKKAEMSSISKYRNWKLLHLSLVKSEGQVPFVSVTHLRIDPIPVSRRKDPEEKYYYWKFTQAKITEEGELNSYGVIIKNYNQLMFVGQAIYTQDNDIKDEGTQFTLFRDKLYNNESLSGIMLGAINFKEHDSCATRVMLVPDENMSIKNTGIIPFDSSNDEHKNLLNTLSPSWHMLLPKQIK